MTLINRIVVLLGAVLLLASCASIPKGAVAIEGFEKEKYLGKWYEIARYDFTFERNLDNTTAEYSPLDKGYIAVKNRGFNYQKGTWEEANGRARFRGADTKAELEVSFFGPFFSGYNVIALDPEYRYALVAGSSTKFLWILSRTPTIPDDVKEQYLALAKSLGYDLSTFKFINHDKAEN